jgi:hypothetical protein
MLGVSAVMAHYAWCLMLLGVELRCVRQARHAGQLVPVKQVGRWVFCVLMH